MRGNGGRLGGLRQRCTSVASASRAAAVVVVGSATSSRPPPPQMSNCYVGGAVRISSPLLLASSPCLRRRRCAMAGGGARQLSPVSSSAGRVFGDPDSAAGYNEAGCRFTPGGAHLTCARIHRLKPN